LAGCWSSCSHRSGLIAVLFISAVVIHAVLRLVARPSETLETTTRVLAFSCGPRLFNVVPVIGPWVGAIWSIVLIVIGLREAHATTSARALAAVLIPLAAAIMLTILVLVMMTVLLTILGIEKGFGL
jgi:hypothetical protein